MTQSSLSVRRLRVTAAAPLASRIGFAARMEDALRTSSLPAGWKGRLVLIRRLRLRAGERWPAHLLARRIEETWRTDAAQAIPADRANADAPAVWFADEANARLALIERLARSGDVSAWFWQRWLPPGADVTRRIAQLLVAPDSGMLAAEERVRFFADACRAIADPALIDRVIAGFDVAQLRWLLPESLLQVMLNDTNARSRFSDSGANGRREPRSTGPASLEEPELKEVARQLARVALGSRSGSLPSGVAGGRSFMDLRADSSASVEGACADTEWAGLFFALNLFRYVGPSDACVGWLRDIAAFVRVAADDPLLTVLDRLDGSGSNQKGDTNEIRRPGPLHELRLACLRMTRRPLRRVLHRAGRVHLNRTHLTIALRLAEVSLPARVAGLDIDPGWVVSLGRVVRFEYD